MADWPAPAASAASTAPVGSTSSGGKGPAPGAPLIEQPNGLPPQQPWAAAGPAGSLGPTRGLAGGFFDQLRKSFNQEVEKNKEFKESLSKLKVRVCVRVWVCMCVCMYGSCRWCPTFRV